MKYVTYTIVKTSKVRKPIVNIGAELDTKFKKRYLAISRTLGMHRNYAYPGPTPQDKTRSLPPLILNKIDTDYRLFQFVGYRLGLDNVTDINNSVEDVVRMSLKALKHEIQHQ